MPGLIQQSQQQSIAAWVQRACTCLTEPFGLPAEVCCTSGRTQPLCWQSWQNTGGINKGLLSTVLLTLPKCLEDNSSSKAKAVRRSYSRALCTLSCLTVCSCR